MAELYLTGAVSNWDEPWAWHDSAKDDYPDHKFINPFFLNQHGFGDDEVYQNPETVVEPALEKLEEVDGMLVRYDNEAPMPGTDMEIRHAFEQGIPVVIWDVSNTSKRLSPWLLYHTRYNTPDRDQALRTLLMYAGESAEDVVGK